jgi:hypothetical protein
MRSAIETTISGKYEDRVHAPGFTARHLAYGIIAINTPGHITSKSPLSKST